MWSKQSLFEGAARVPMMIRAPEFAKGKSCPSPVELIDIFPTLAGLCGLPVPASVEGASLRPLLENPNAAWNKPAYTFQHRGEVSGASVRTERYRYTEWDGGRAGRELYDYQTDPGENHNLADDSRQSKLAADMKRPLDQG